MSYSRTRLISPRSIQVTPSALNTASAFMKRQGLDKVLADGAEHVRNSQATANQQRMIRAGLKDSIDYTSIYWAFGISIALFLVVTMLRNK